jgi:hypothetical protein
MAARKKPAVERLSLGDSSSRERVRSAWVETSVQQNKAIAVTGFDLWERHSTRDRLPCISDIGPNDSPCLFRSLPSKPSTLKHPYSKLSRPSYLLLHHWSPPLLRMPTSLVLTANPPRQGSSTFGPFTSHPSKPVRRSSSATPNHVTLPCHVTHALHLSAGRPQLPRDVPLLPRKLRNPPLPHRPPHNLSHPGNSGRSESHGPDRTAGGVRHSAPRVRGPFGAHVPAGV